MAIRFFRLMQPNQTKTHWRVNGEFPDPVITTQQIVEEDTGFLITQNGMTVPDIQAIANNEEITDIEYYTYHLETAYRLPVT